MCVFIFTFTFMFTCTSILNTSPNAHVVSIRGRVGTFCWLRRYAENNTGHQIDSRLRARLLLTPFSAEDMKCRSGRFGARNVRRQPDRCRPIGKKCFFTTFVRFLVRSKLVCARALHLACILRNTFCGMKNRL